MATFRKRGNYWEYRIRERELVGDDPISKGGFRTKSEAKAEADKVEFELRVGVNRDEGNMLFPQYYERWIEAYKLGAFSFTTDEEYLHALRLVQKHFKNMKLKDITKLDYQNFLNEYSDGKARSTVQKVHKKIAPCLREAFENNHMNVNVTSKVVLRGAEGQKESEKYLNLSEAQKLMEGLLKGLNNTMTTRYMVILQLATGMRISEVMALQFKDFDFLHNRVNINKSWDYKRSNDFAPTKNKGQRNILVDEKTMSIIRKFYDHQLSQKVQDNKQRVFAVKGDVPIPASANEMLRRACKRIGIQRVTTHAMRHTHASMLILQGADITYVSERLGHKSITITLERYSHVLNELRTKGEEQSLEIVASLY